MTMMTGMTNRSDRAADLRILLLLFTALVSVVLAFIYLNPLRNVQIPEGEYLLLSEADALPLDIGLAELSQYESNWEPASFPLHWRNQFSGAPAVWYRLHVSAAELTSLASNGSSTDNQPLGVYIWRLNQTADIWFNGQKIGSGGNTGEPMARYWNSPLYFSIPTSLVEGSNEILIKHFALHSWGSMEPIILGLESALKPVYEQRYFVQHDIALGLFVFVLVTGLFSFSVWFYRRQETQYLWFAIASAGMSFYCLNQFIRYLPFNADLWRWISNITTDLWAAAVFIFILRNLKLDKPVAERLVVLYLLSGIPVYFYASFFQVFDINIYYHVGSLLIGVYGIYICAQSYLQTRNVLPAFYCSVIALIFVIGVHDTIMQAVVNNGWQESSQAGFQNGFNSVHFAAPVFFLFIAASLIKQFVNSMNAADSLNRELEQRVSEAREELAENYRSIEEVLVKQSASEERERIFRDLHDDVGSKLLSLYYRLDKESDSILAKSALEDLRDIVSHKSLESCSLNNAVQQWKQEVSERVRDADVSLSWQCDFASNDVVLSEMQHTQLRRMFREVISNALLHSKDISEINVNIQANQSSLSITVANDGAPKPVSSWKAGRGISNLRVRSRDLQGEFGINDLDGSWIQVAWTVPMEPA